MSASYNAFHRKEWAEAGLRDYGDFAECVEYVNQEEDYCDSLRGEWYYADEEKRVIYSGTFGNDHSPGASMYTYAEVYEEDEHDEFLATVKQWEAKPEYLESEDEEDEEAEEWEDFDTDECDLV